MLSNKDFIKYYNVYNCVRLILVQKVGYSMDNKLKSLISKLQNMIKGGTPNEVEVACNKLEQLVIKYNIDLTELDSEELVELSISFHNIYEKKILAQVIHKVTNTLNNVYSKVKGYGSRSQLIVKRITPSQKYEIEVLYDYYKELMYSEIDTLMYAFICKHRIYGDTDDDDSDTSTKDQQFLARVYQMMDSLQDGNIIVYKNRLLE